MLCLFFNSQSILLAQHLAPLKLLTIENGLSNNSVRTIYQDHNGFMWFATYDGLNRYDGRSFRIFRNVFNDSGSLVNNVVSALTEDRSGRIWVGTRQGVSIYDKLSDHFIHLQVRQPTGRFIQLNDVIKDIKADATNNVFIGSENKGLFLCTPGSTQASHIAILGLPDNADYGIQAIATDVNGKTYVFVQGRGVYVLDQAHYELFPVSNVISRASCMVNKLGQLWIGSGAFVYQLNTTNSSINRKFGIDTTDKLLNQVNALCFDETGRLWIGTSVSGIEIHNPNGTVQKLVPGDSKQSLSAGNIYSIFLDNQSRKWIGTAKGGVDVVDPALAKVETITHDPANPKTISGNVVSGVFPYNDSILWIGTEGNGLNIWDRKKNTTLNIRDIKGGGALVSEHIIGMHRDKYGDIWLSSFINGVYRYNTGSNSFEHYDLRSSAPGRQSKVAYKIFEDHQNNLWATTLRSGDLKGGLFLFNRQQNQFELFDAGLSDLFSLIEDKDGTLWGGDLTCLIKINLKHQQHTYFPLGNSVRSIYELPNHQLWIGTEGGGLVLFDTKLQKIVKRLTTEDGLCNNSITATEADNQDNLWLSTYDGLSCFNMSKQSFTNYFKSDGLQSNQFNLNASARLSTGELAFGGIQGVSIFYPEALQTISGKVYNLFFANIVVNGKNISSGSPFVSGFDAESITSLRVPYDDAVFRFDFSSPELSSPEKIRYAYQMEGWDKDWNYIGKSHTATYTHLQEGNYVFRVKATALDGKWNEKELILKIKVLAPWYRSWWAYSAYFGLMIGTALLFINYKSRQSRLKYQIELEKINVEREKAEREKSVAELAREKAEHEKEAAELAREKTERALERSEREAEQLVLKKEQEVNEKRLSFFTNISHEFRTPLSLIINPIKDILEKDKKITEKEMQELEIVYRNARRMLSLTNQLLLFRKEESGMDHIWPVKLNFPALCYDVFLCFSQQARSKDIHYQFIASHDSIELYIDREKAEIILYNLLSNAMKYTPAGGRVIFNLNEEANQVKLEVSDSGPGIDESDVEHIFDKFYQAHAKGTITKPGFGIGLYLARQFTLLHHGEIAVESLKGEGATFKISFLKGKAHFVPEQLLQTGHSESTEGFLQEIADREMDPKEENTIVSFSKPEAINQPITSEKKSLLVIDDDPSIREYLSLIFKDTYTVYESDNGEMGIQLAKKYLPDMIISDVMMGNVSGIDVCKQIKDEPSLSHIPVILLTGTTSDDLRLQGVKGGADDYIMKPFDRELLMARVSNLLKNRNALQKYFYNEITLSQHDTRISEQYKDFIDRCIQIVEAHLEDESFTIKTLAVEIGMSYSSVTKKIKAISGQSLNAFIRFIRLRKAAQLFIDTSYNVNEVAAMVGILSIKYFRQQFSLLFGLNPSEYIKKYRKPFASKFSVNKDILNTNSRTTE